MTCQLCQLSSGLEIVCLTLDATKENQQCANIYLLCDLYCHIQNILHPFSPLDFCSVMQKIQKRLVSLPKPASAALLAVAYHTLILLREEESLARSDFSVLDTHHPNHSRIETTILLHASH
uniref:Uncharacterized protein n=1 Tax=Opuntia streptacantha TaxID=393608 RepID=A0A7C9ANN3_OPUST